MGNQTYPGFHKRSKTSMRVNSLFKNDQNGLDRSENVPGIEMQKKISITSENPNYFFKQISKTTETTPRKPPNLAKQIKEIQTTLSTPKTHQDFRKRIKQSNTLKKTSENLKADRHVQEFANAFKQRTSFSNDKTCKITQRTFSKQHNFQN